VSSNQMVWALAMLDTPAKGNLSNTLWAAAERETPSMNMQNVSNTVWALTTLNTAPVDSLLDALWAATGRMAPSMKPQEVGNRVWHRLPLVRPPHMKFIVSRGSLKSALVRIPRT
jgi:hypothetical protein